MAYLKVIQHNRPAALINLDQVRQIAVTLGPHMVEDRIHIDWASGTNYDTLHVRPGQGAAAFEALVAAIQGGITVVDLQEFQR